MKEKRAVLLLMFLVLIYARIGLTPDALNFTPDCLHNKGLGDDGAKRKAQRAKRTSPTAILSKFISTVLEHKKIEPLPLPEPAPPLTDF